MQQSESPHGHEQMHAEALHARSVHSASQAPSERMRTVRRLREPDRAALETLLRVEPGYSLFLAGNLAHYSLDTPVMDYWGTFVGEQLDAVLMLVARRGALYAPRGRDVSPLVEVARTSGLEFTMGRDDLVDVLLAPFADGYETRREEHRLAHLARLPAAVALPAGAVVRRATPDDLDALTRFYLGTDGFETLSEEQVRRTMAGRLHGLRTYLIRAGGEIVAAASTSAEAPAAAMIGGVWTAPHARNRGYSTAVVSVLAGELLAEQRHPYLFYLHDNAVAERVYQRVGFQSSGRWSLAYIQPREV